MQPGALLLAQMTGLPLVPLAFDTTRKITLKTWDRMIIPLPFGHVHATFADPVYIPRETRELAPYIEQLQQTMNRICADVEERVRQSK